MRSIYLAACLQSAHRCSSVRIWLLPSAMLWFWRFTLNNELQRRHIYSSSASEGTVVLFGTRPGSNYWCFPMKNCKNFCFHLQQTPANFWGNKSTDRSASIRRPPRSNKHPVLFSIPNRITSLPSRRDVLSTRSSWCLDPPPPSTVYTHRHTHVRTQKRKTHPFISHCQTWLK